MKGVLLAGGKGTRLYPCTKVTNKHLLPVFNKPMIFYPLETLINSGIREILIITGREHMGAVIQTLGSGKDFGVEFTYKVQDQAGGIAEALLLAEDFVKNDNVAVVLGDNIFEENFRSDVLDFTGGAKIFLKKVDDPQRFGVAEVKNSKVMRIIEKPKKFISDLAVTGFYLYDCEVFDIIRSQKYSDRRELEITDTNRYYLVHHRLTYRILEGFWSDAGTFISLFKSSQHFYERENKAKQ